MSKAVQSRHWCLSKCCWTAPHSLLLVVGTCPRSGAAQHPQHSAPTWPTQRAPAAAAGPACGGPPPAQHATSARQLPLAHAPPTAAGGGGPPDGERRSCVVAGSHDTAAAPGPFCKGPRWLEGRREPPDYFHPKRRRAGAHRLPGAGGSLCQASVARHLGLQQVSRQLLSQPTLALFERCSPRLHQSVAPGCTSHHALQPLLPLGISTGQLLLHSKHGQGGQAADHGGRLQGWRAQASWVGCVNAGTCMQHSFQGSGEAGLLSIKWQ